jgi:hypothetical protein
MPVFAPLVAPDVLKPVRYGPDRSQVLSPAQHKKLVSHLFTLLDRAHPELEKRRANARAIELDLLGTVVPEGTDSERKQKRDEGTAVSVPDAIYPFGWFTLQQFASELASIVMPMEMPYAVVASADDQNFANRAAKAFRHQGVMFDHRNHVNAAIFDMIALNVGAMRFDWSEIPKANVEQSYAGTPMSVPGAVAGLRVQHLDPYNVFWDPAVSVPDVPLEAEFFGDYTLRTPFSLRRAAAKGRCFLEPEILAAFERWSTRNEHGEFAYRDDLNIPGWLVAPNSNSRLYPYYTPIIARSRELSRRLWGSRQEPQTNFSGLWSDNAEGDSNGNMLPQDRIHVTRMFVRLRASEWGLGLPVPAAQRATEPFTCWEIHIAGPGVICYARQLDTGLDRFPCALGDMNFDRGFDRGFQFGGQAAQLGLLASTIMNMHKRAMRKGLEGGVTIYDPSVIPLERLDDMSGGRVPVSQLKAGESIRDRVLQLSDMPDTNNSLRDAQGLADILRGLFPTNSQPAMAGLDRATTYQAQAVIMTGMRSLLYYAALGDGMLMVPLRYHLQYETIKNRASMDYVDETTNQLMEMRAEELGGNRMMLVQSQPLMGIDKLRATNELRDMINIVFQSGGQMPPIAAFYMRHYLEMAAFPIDPQEYEQAVEQQMQFNATQQAQQGAAPSQPGPGAPPAAQAPI